MSDDSQYQGSQAFNQSYTANEFVTRNTGSLNVTKAIVNLRGIAAGVGLTLNLSYMAGTAGSLGLPANWGFGISFVIPGASLTAQGKTSVIDPTWADSNGYQSGLRYVNDHGMKFQSIVPPQNLPSGQGTYSFLMLYDDGARDYFDATGKLVEHDDLFGNRIGYFYADPFSGPLDNRLEHIVDSFGQTVHFGYGPNAIFVTTPDGTSTTINFSEQGVQNVQDALGNYTAFTYVTIAGQTLIATIAYPTGLQTRLLYTTLAYYTASGVQAAFPAVSDHYHLNAHGVVLDHTGYAFGTDSGGNTFTGFSAQYRMSSGADSLMDSNNTAYGYDVLVRRFASDDTLLAASRVYYNYLHLPTREEHYLISSNGVISNGYRALYAYNVDPDYHARSSTYSLPVLTQQFVYSSETQQYLALRQSTASYDQWGRIVSGEEFLFDAASKAYVSQMSTSNTYTVTGWGGEMPLTEIYIDHVSGFQRQITYALTADQKNIASSAVSYRANAQAAWSPWKTKVFAYDANGRVTRTTLSWSPGVTPPGGVSSTSSTNAYAFSAATRVYAMATTDALGNTTTQSYDVGLVTGPVIRSTTPLGESSTYAYDALGRIVHETDALGHVTSTTYALVGIGGSVNNVTATGPTGYVVATNHDELGRIVAVMDNGNPNGNGGAPTRTLRLAGYDALGRIISASDELGLVTTTAYDSLSRAISSTDAHGNVHTTTYDDAAGTISDAINGALRRRTQLDNFGRSIAVTDVADSSDSSITYTLQHQTSYDGFGLVRTTRAFSVPLAGGDPQLLYRADVVRNVEGAIATETDVGQLGSPVTVERTTAYDVFGNPISKVKQTTYADGRAYHHVGSTPTFDTAGRLTSITNQLGQVERYTYDADGRLQARTRFDGTVFTSNYDANGQLLGMSWPDGAITYTYTPTGRTQSITTAGATVQYEYALDGSARRVRFPDGRTQSYTLDTTSRVVSSTDASGAVSRITYDALGRIARREQGGDVLTYAYGTVNNTFGMPVGDSLEGNQTLRRKLAYDGFGQTRSVVISNAGGDQVLVAHMQREAAGRLASISLASSTSTAAQVNYTRVLQYDGLNQLTGRTTTYGSGPAGVEQFVFDGNFNVLSRTQSGSTANFTYNAIDQLSIAGIVYDVNGRMTADGNGRTYVYNALDQIVAVNEAAAPVVTYRYHPDGALAASTAGTGTIGFYYDSGAANAIASSSTASAPPAWTSFMIDASSRRAAYAQGYPPSYYLAGSESTSMLQQSGIASITLDYDAYGVVDGSAPVAAEKSFTWNQEYVDPSSKLVYLRARYYNPALMSFMSMDSLTMDNRYAYCSGDPINMVDPAGHMNTAEIIGLVVGAVVGIGATIVTGGVAGAAAAAVFGTESIAVSIGASALAGAAGSIAGDATNAGISGQKFTAERALVDLASGAVGGAVGAGIGGYAGRTAMSAALAEGMSQRAITNIGLICSGVAGGVSGSFAASAVTSAMTGEDFFSANTALSMFVGAAAGVGGGFLTSGAYLGKLNAKIIPVPLTEAELGLITPARDTFGANLSKKLLVMAPVPEAEASAKGFAKLPGGYRSAQTLDYKASSPTYDTIAAHGAGNTMFASVEYQPGVAPTGDPNFVRPIKGSLFAKYLLSDPSLVGGTNSKEPIKLMTCFGAFSNAQTIADALQRPIWAGYPEIDRYSFTNWKPFGNF